MPTNGKSFNVMKAYIFAGVGHVASLPAEALGSAGAEASEGSKCVVAAASVLTRVCQALVNVL